LKIKRYNFIQQYHALLGSGIAWVLVPGEQNIFVSPPTKTAEFEENKRVLFLYDNI